MVSISPVHKLFDFKSGKVMRVNLWVIIGESHVKRTGELTHPRGAPVLLDLGSIIAFFFLPFHVKKDMII